MDFNLELVDLIRQSNEQSTKHDEMILRVIEEMIKRIKQLEADVDFLMKEN